MHLTFESKSQPNVTVDMHAPHLERITTDSIVALIIAHGGNPDSDWSVTDVRWTDRYVAEIGGDRIDAWEHEHDALTDLHGPEFYGHGHPVRLYDRQDWELLDTLDTSCCTGVTGPCPTDH